MPYLLKRATVVVAVTIAAAALAGPATATPLGMSELAKNKELAEGAKNHGAMVSEAAKQLGGASTHYVGTLNSESSLSSSVSSSSSVPEPGTLLFLAGGLFGLASWRRWSHEDQAV
jgi:hypothetical protein